MRQLLLTSIAGILLSILLANLLIDQQERHNVQLQEKEDYIRELNDKNEQLQQDVQSKTKIINHDRITIEKQDATVNKLKNEINKLKKEVESLKREEKVSRGTQKKKSFIVEMTSYTAFCKEGCTGKTKTEYDVSNTIHYKGYRIVAVDPSLIPLHSFLKVETEKETFYAYAIDTGSAIKNYKIDLLVEDKKTAKQNGVQQAKVTILKEG